MARERSAAPRGVVSSSLSRHATRNALDATVRLRNGAVLWIAIAVVVAAVALGSLQPALRAGGLDPLDALRRE